MEERIQIINNLLKSEYFSVIARNEPVIIKIPKISLQKEFFKTTFKGVIILYKNKLYDVIGPYNEDESKLIFLDYYKRNRNKVNSIIEPKEEAKMKLRKPITTNVKLEVWRRDEGKCVECGSSFNLEYDHIIPVSKGGSNTARNIQLLCESCNRKKHDKIQ